MALRKTVFALAASLLGLPAAAQVIEFYTLDAAGNIRVVTDQAGAVIERRDYLPFGEECVTGSCGGNPSITPRQPLRFAGKERDSETGLEYFGARYYSSLPGRFTTTDPAMDLEGALADPQRWNRYAYAKNNPLRYVDPDGRQLVQVWAFILANAHQGPKLIEIVTKYVTDTELPLGVLPTGGLLDDIDLLLDAGKALNTMRTATTTQKAPSLAAPRAPKAGVPGADWRGSSRQFGELVSPFAPLVSPDVRLLLQEMWNALNTIRVATSTQKAADQGQRK